MKRRMVPTKDMTSDIDSAYSDGAYPDIQGTGCKLLEQHI